MGFKICMIFIYIFNSYVYMKICLCIYGQMENFTRKLEFLENSSKITLALENISRMKNPINLFNSTFRTAQARTFDLKDKSVNVDQTEAQRD